MTLFIISYRGETVAYALNSLKWNSKISKIKTAPLAYVKDFCYNKFMHFLETDIETSSG